MAGLIRRFNDERATLFTPPGAFGYLAGAAAIMAGVLWNGLNGDAAHSLLTFWAVTAMVLLLVMFSPVGCMSLFADKSKVPGWQPLAFGALLTVLLAFLVGRRYRALARTPR